MEKRKAEHNRRYDENFWLSHRWDREVWCQSCKIYHGMREEAKEKCEERKRAAKEEEEKRLLETRDSQSPCYDDFQERSLSSREESPEEIAPPSPPRVDHGAEAWAFYQEREAQKRGFLTDPQRGSRPRLRALAPEPQSREDTIPLPQDPWYLTSTTSQYQPNVAPGPPQQMAQNLYMLNAHPEQQQRSQNPAFTTPRSELLSGAVENLQRLPPINTELFGPMPEIPLRNQGYNPLPEGRIEARSHFRLGPIPYSNLPDQNRPPTAVSDGRYDKQEAERYLSPYNGSKPARPAAVREQSERSRQAGISQTTHPPSREQKSESTKRSLRRPKPRPLTAEQSSRLDTLRSRKRKPSLSVNDLLCAAHEGPDDTVDFAHDQAPARASTRRRLTSPSSSSPSSSSAAFTLSSYKSSSHISNPVREEGEEEMEGVEEGVEAQDDEDDDGDETFYASAGH